MNGIILPIIFENKSQIDKNSRNGSIFTSKRKIKINYWKNRYASTKGSLGWLRKISMDWIQINKLLRKWFSVFERNIRHVIATYVHSLEKISPHNMLLLWRSMQSNGVCLERNTFYWAVTFFLLRKSYQQKPKTKRIDVHLTQWVFSFVSSCVLALWFIRFSFT